MPETGEEVFSSFLGLPIQRLGETLGVLVVQSKEARLLFRGRGLRAGSRGHGAGRNDRTGRLRRRRRGAVRPAQARRGLIRGTIGQEGVAEGHVWLHEPRVVVTNLVADDPRGRTGASERGGRPAARSVDEMLDRVAGGDKDQREVLEAYRMFANSRGWMRRMEEDIARGLSRRGRGGKGAIHGARADADRGATPICANGCTIWMICQQPPAAHPDRSGQRHRGRDARRSDPDRPQHRPGRVAGLRPQAARHRAGRRARSAATPRSSPARWRSRW